MNIEMKNGVYTYNGEDVSFNFYTSLKAYDKLSFVNTVTDVLVGDNYHYAIKNLVFDFYIIPTFTDVDVSKIVSSDDPISSMEDFVNETNIVDIVKMNADYGVIEELEAAVEFNIEYRTGIHINPISSSLSSLLNTIEKKVEDIDLDSMVEFAQSISGISGDITPEKMLDAYAKTDIFKKNWENAGSDKEQSKVAGTTIASESFEA